MDTASVLAQIDAEIETLQRARAALAGLTGTVSTKKPAKRKLSAAARARIAAAQRKRWAAVRAKAKAK